MELSEFAFFHQGKIVKLLTEQDRAYLSAIDQVITSKQEHALLLLHGFASTPAVFREMLPRISGFDRILCPLLPGHGISIQAFAQSTAQQWQEAAAQACAQLCRDYAKVSVAGLSLGGSLALELSQQFQLEHLYLYAPALKLYFSAGLASWAAWGLQRLGFKSLANHGGDVYSEHAQELSYQRLPLATIEEILDYIHSQTYAIPTCPTDIFLGQFDKVVDVQAVAHRYENQNHIHIHWLKNSAHVLPIDGDQSILTRFLIP